jgi:hypothetical protein
MGVLDIYRHESDGSLSWVTTVDSMKMARMTIRASATSASEEFVIHDDQANESITLRADGHWFYEKTDHKRLTPTSQASTPLPGVSR